VLLLGSFPEEGYTSPSSTPTMNETQTALSVSSAPGPGAGNTCGRVMWSDGVFQLFEMTPTLLPFAEGSSLERGDQPHA
jgi:hypothetical protein